MQEPTQPSISVEYGYANAEYRTAPYLLSGIRKALEPLYAAGARSLLEIGCGTGYTAAELAAAGWQVTATDASEEGIAVARATYGDRGVRFDPASVYDVDWTERFGKFDVVLSIEVIEHLQLPRALLWRAAESLRPNGQLVLTTPYHGYLKNLMLSLTNRWDHHFAVDWDAGHVRFFSPRSMANLARACGFANGSWRGLGRVPGLWKSFLYQTALR